MQQPLLASATRCQEVAASSAAAGASPSGGGLCGVHQLAPHSLQPLRVRPLQHRCSRATRTLPCDPPSQAPSRCHHPWRESSVTPRASTHPPLSCQTPAPSARLKGIWICTCEPASRHRRPLADPHPTAPHLPCGASSGGLLSRKRTKQSLSRRFTQGEVFAPPAKHSPASVGDLSGCCCFFRPQGPCLEPSVASPGLDLEPMSDHPQDRLTPSHSTSSPTLPSGSTPSAGLAEVALSPPSAPDELRTEQQGQSSSQSGQGDGGNRGADRGVESCCDTLTGSLRVSGCASAAAESASITVAGLQPLPPRKSGAARINKCEASQQPQQHQKQQQQQQQNQQQQQQQQQQQHCFQEVTHQQHQPWQQSQRSSAPADAGAEVAVHTRGQHDEERGHEESERGLDASKRRQDDDETALPAGLDGKRMPRHVAIILDGNSRWAKRRGLPREMGHEAGVQALKRIVRMAGHWGIQALTVFAFSTENWNRPKMEVDFIMALMERMMDDDIEELHSQGVAIHIMGQKARLAPSLQRKAAQAEQRTAGNTRLRLTVALSYSGRQDIVHACQALAAAVAAGRLQPEDIDEAAVDSALGTAWLGPGLESPDLLIRTSGEQRLSNFLLWQAAYSELVFSPCLWPDFGRAEFTDCLAQFQKRDRRFGKRDGEAEDGQKPQQ